MGQRRALGALAVLVVIGGAVAGGSSPVLATSRNLLHEGSERPGRLNAVAALSPTDVWAVGYAGDASRQTVLIKHWDGSGWRRVPAPHPGHGGGLRSVSAVSANDVWAAGYSGHKGVGGHPLVLHWDGDTWTESPFDRMEESATVRGISADAPDDVWAVGGSVFGGDSSFIEHWDGSTWSRLTNPNGATLLGVSAVSPTDAWAAGYLERGRRTELTAALHWDGQRWTVEPTVDPHYRHNLLWGVSALPSGRAWAVGTWGDERTLVEQWDGNAWSKVDAPSPKYYSDLYAVSAEADDDVWAVGQQGNSAIPDNLVEHWDGIRWSRFATPKPDEYANLLGVSADSPDDAWAVGFVVYPDYADPYPWLQHWDGDHWTRA